MNRMVLFIASFCAISSGALGQTMRPGANSPMSANSFGGSRQPAPAAINPGPTVSTWSFGASPYSMTPLSTRTAGSSPTPSAGWSFGGSSYATTPITPAAANSATAGADTRSGAMTDSALRDLQAGITNATPASRSYSIRQEAASDLLLYSAPAATPTIVGSQPAPVTPYSGAPISTQPIR